MFIVYVNEGIGGFTFTDFERVSRNHKPEELFPKWEEKSAFCSLGGLESLTFLLFQTNRSLSASTLTCGVLVTFVYHSVSHLIVFLSSCNSNTPPIALP